MSRTETNQVVHPPSSKAWPIAILFLRLLIFLFLMVSIIILTTDTVTVRVNFIKPYKARFKDVHAYRYVLSVSVMALAYTLLQIPFAIYFVSTGKKISIALVHFDLIGDKVAAFLLATGVGAGFGATIDLKMLADAFIELIQSVSDTLDHYSSFDANDLIHELEKFDKFYNMVNLSVGFLHMAFFCMAILSVVSSYALTNRGV